jgi:hypothetical protein
MRSFWRYFAAAILLAGAAQAATIVSISGGGRDIESADSSDWSAESWTQSLDYTNVTIRINVEPAVLPPVDYSGMAYLEQPSGSHAVVVASTSFTFPMSYGQITLFTGLSLDAGTYYLATYGGGFWDAEIVPTINQASDVTNVSDTLYSTNSGHTFIDTNNGLYLDMRITGTPAATAPEPAALWLAGLGLIALMTMRRVLPAPECAFVRAGARRRAPDGRNCAGMRWS